MTPRPKNPPKVTKDDLLPGDVLLSTGTDLLAKTIMAIDNTDYSHSTLYAGKDGENFMVIEATRQGICHNTIKIDTDAQVLMDVYRYKSNDGHHFDDQDWPAQPVIDEAMSYVGGDYAYDRLLLLGVVLSLARFPSDSAKKLLIRLAADKLMEKLTAWLEKNKNKTPMTCVQVNTSAFWSAASDPSNKYALGVNLPYTPIEPASPTAAQIKDTAHYNKTRNEVRGLIQQYYPSLIVDRTPPLHAAADSTYIAGSDALPAGSCSLHDLQTSPNLELIGNLLDKRK